MFIVEIFELVIIEKGITLSPTFEKRFTRFFLAFVFTYTAQYFCKKEFIL